MKKLAASGRLSLVLLATLGVVLLGVNGANAAPPEEITIEFSLFLTGPDSAAGTFTASGAVVDTGAASQIFRLAGPHTAHGVKTLEGAEGTITIKYQAKSVPTSPVTAMALGRFVILSGTGAYKNLHGTGTTEATIDFVAGTITGSYVGKAHFDNRKEE